MEINIFWDMTSCLLFYVCHRFIRTCYIYPHENWI